ncbi:MAG TPA: hypothetical protein VFX96_10345, partial [Pyrinomonadaceae bacterium]|nr:hypothetical protein [Pyrinomonadaceae bacterium]
HAEMFEFLTYTPPHGWVNQSLQDGVAYRRPSGIGLITFYASNQATGSASDEFVRMWRARVEPTLPGPAPQPQLQSEGDYALAVGSRTVDAQGTITTIALVTIVGRGRAIGVLTLVAGDEALREVSAFLDSLKITPGAPAPATPNSGPSAPGEIEVDFDVPPGYVARREGRMVVLTPTTVDDKTPCAYGVSPARPSSGALDADARAAILEALPGWQLKSDAFNAMRGTAGAGWPYYWFRTDAQRLVGGSYEYASAMTMAFPAGPGRVNIIWGIGNPARCLSDDLSFARLFHSLRPRGWTSDDGKALSRDLQGTWRNSQRLGLAQYKFLPNGRYEFGIGTVTTTGLLERTSSSVSDGRYELRGGELIINPDRRDRGVSKYRVRIYDEFVQGRWMRAMSLLDENANPALEVQYMRIDDSR